MSRTSIDRRTLLRSGLAGAASLALGARPGLAADISGKPAPGKIGDFKISLAEWSLHTMLRKGELKNLDFPAFARERFGIGAVEFVNQFFKDKARDDAYLKDLKKRADDQGVTCVLIMIDSEGDLSDPNKVERAAAVEKHKAWVDAAASLGCHAIRVNTGNNYGPDDVEGVGEACAALTEYGESRNISIICENHGGPSSNPDALIPLMKRVNKPRFGTLPDFGNFPKDKRDVYLLDVYDAIARMMPYAKGVSAKSHDFRPDGTESHLDFARIMKIVTDAGYHNYVGIEYEGTKIPEVDGVVATKKLLEKLRGAEYAG